MNLAKVSSPRSFGMWLSLVERLVRDEEVGGSNPLIPTKIQSSDSTCLLSIFLTVTFFTGSPSIGLPET